MAKKISKEDVQNALAKVRHPEIDRTLLDLGMIKEISVEENKVTIIMAFPFPNVPIADYLISSVKDPIEKLGAEVDVKTTVMSQEELERFFAMEQEYWKGGI